MWTAKNSGSGPTTAKASERLIDGVVVRPVEGLGARLLLFGTQPDVTGNDNSVAHLQYRLRVARLTVEVDHQPRVAGEHRRRVQAVRQKAGQLGGADVPSDVP